jgi:rare lipoprotein A (peptidoglycan hydrolase)
MGLGTRIVLVVGVFGAYLLFSKKSRASVPGGPGFDAGSEVLAEETTASFYGPGFHGRLTANGETFDQDALTAAMRSPMPFNTRVRVTDLDNGRSVVVRINDRGPFTKRSDGSFARSIDLSVGAAAAIGLDIQKGLARVRLERV